MKNLFTLTILYLLIYSTNCKKKNGKKKDGEKFAAIQNICDDNNREAVICFCTQTEPDAAKEAVCWVYRSKISGNDSVWESFASQPNLEKLKFNIRPDGTLLNIPTNALKYLSELQSLEIQYGFINELTPFVFSNLTTITEISIPQNNISSLSEYAIANLPSVSTINLDGNKISELKRDSIRDVPSLKMLYINRNDLSIIHDFAFSHLHKLEELELNTNQISILTKDTFAGMKTLRYLDLRKNRINMIGEYTFEGVPNLYELLLDQNNIEYISSKGFSGLAKLTKLRLSENQLKRLGNDVFKESPNIHVLDLRMNGLESVSYETLEPLWDNFKNNTSNIWLEKNRLKCDCRLSWIHSLRNETGNTEMKLSLEQLTCITDELFVENSNAMAKSTEKPQDDQPFNVDVDTLQYDDEEVEYEDETLSTEYENEPGKPPRKKIFDIPIEKLPCPEMQTATTEMPGQSNIAFWPEASSSNSRAAIGYSLHYLAWSFLIFSAWLPLMMA